MSFSGKVVVVTGASSGIGAATAVMFCNEGASVALVGRNDTKLKNTAEKCSTAGGKHIIIKADVTNNDDAKRIINETVKEFGKLDILVNNAGAVAFGTLLDGTSLEVYDKLFNVNLRAAINLTMLASPHLTKSKGNIVNISSVGGKWVPVPKFTIYCATKAALEHFTRGAALELAPFGVRVNAISPGPVSTDIYENAGYSIDEEFSLLNVADDRVSPPEEIGNLVLFLASDKAKGITGSVYVSDNGVSLH